MYTHKHMYIHKPCNLTYGPHVAHGYRAKLQRERYTERRTTDMIIIISQLNRLVWDSLTLAPMPPSVCMYTVYWQNVVS